MVGGGLKLPLAVRKENEMGETRFKNGLAYGPYGNFYATTAGVFSQNDTTPDVSNGVIFYSNNTSTTAITHFDLQAPPGDTSPTFSQAYEGKYIKVIFLDDSTRLVRGSQLVISGSDGAQGTNTALEFLYHNSAWVQTGVSHNAQSSVETTSGGLGVTGIVNVVGGVKVIKLASFASSSNILRRAVNGEENSILTVVGFGGSDGTIIVNSAAQGTFVSTSSASSTQVTVASNASVSFVSQRGKWIEIRQAVL